MSWSAAEEVADPDLRDRICRRLMAAASRASRKLAAAERLRLDPNSDGFDLPTSAEQRDFNKLMAELDQSRLAALRSLRQGKQNPSKCA